MAVKQHIHLDTVGGIAGDMFVAALLDARPDLQTVVHADLAKALPAGVGKPTLNSGSSSGLAVKRFELARSRRARQSLKTNTAPVNYSDFLKLIKRAALSVRTSEIACGILQRIAAAEAEVHNVPLRSVHFHELADWDTLMDVVAAASIISALKDASWSISSLPLGGGFVKAAHGRLPIPAPATAQILKGYRWHDDGVEGERVTPTGAAIAAHVTDSRGNGNRVAGVLKSVGLGAGIRTLPGIPNILRATIFGIEGSLSELLTILAFEIDDMTGEEIATAADKLRGADGVRDVLLIGGQGKKGRPITKIEVQAEPSQADAVMRLIFTETATLGVRRHDLNRHTLGRQVDITPRGLRRKKAFRPDGNHTFKVESEDLAKIAGLAARRKARTEAEQ